MALPAAIGIGVATFAVSEAIAALLENWAGDPEAAVAGALAQIQEKAQYDAMTAYNQDAEVEGAVAQAFKGVQPRSLTELAMYQQGIYDDASQKPVLSYVSRSLGITPQEFVERTSPTRMGDLSTFQRALGPSMIEKPIQAPPPSGPAMPNPLPPMPGAGQPQLMGGPNG